MRLSQKNKSGALFAVFFMLMLCASAQKTFKYQAKLDAIGSSGFYKITLSPAFIAKSNAGLTDIRIIDEKGNFVPYITSANAPHIDSEVFIAYPEIRQKRDTGTAYIVENKADATINRLWLKLKSTAVKRTVNLYGSDDLQQWFAIDEDVLLQAATPDNNGSYMQSISFPASNYKYFKVLVNDKNKAPLKFLQAGVYTSRAILNTNQNVPFVNFIKTDTAKTTRVTINLDDNYLVNLLVLDIDNPKYYKRDVAVYAYSSQGRQLATTTDVMSGKKGAILINAKTKKIEIEIDNGDNPPLHIKHIGLSQWDDPILAYLEAGHTYKLLTGDAKAAAPVYDLKFFADSIHTGLPAIAAGKVEHNLLSAAPEVKPPAPDYTIVIWIVIVGALLLLTLLTVKMTKEVNKKNGESA